MCTIVVSSNSRLLITTATMKSHQQFLHKTGIFAQYGVLKNYTENITSPPDQESMESILGITNAKPVIDTCNQLFYGHTDTTKLNEYRFIDEELHDLIMDELRLDCPDEVLILSFFMKVYSSESSLIGGVVSRP